MIGVGPAPPTPPEEFHCERLLLRRPREADADAIYDYARRPAVTRFVSWDPHPGIATTRAFLQTLRHDWNRRTDYAWVLERNADGVVLGMLGIRPQGHRVEMGYVLHPEHQGAGYMTEAVRRVCDWTAEQPRPLRLWATVVVGNEPSRQVLIRAGFLEEGILRDWLVFSDGPHDAYVFSFAAS